MINLNLIFLIYNLQRSFSLIYKSRILIFIFDFIIIIFKFIVINISNRFKLRIKYINSYFFEAKMTLYVIIYRKHISYTLFKIEQLNFVNFS